jgi:Fur family ferric uptake transcriptional regulator
MRLAVRPTPGRVVEHNHRDRFICTTCGDVVELENPEIEELQVEAARQHGFSVDSLNLELHGRCSSCLGNAKGVGE